ncbi:hypothetical protein L1999_14000 [Neobacillus drentensis]|uniref:hypothetical protein n=1 Tax=Neobacillus drentensis TaxID=220684 RepID=UPI001F179A94|nr:hypothetical protein [Neobacillus drentensis]ULT59563.1 hypothetical protein L1999_14000 [Neobacillus drentensis]
MKTFSKMTNRLGRFVLLLCFLVGGAWTSSISALAAPDKTVGSAENGGIKLTITNYAITNYGQEMILYYTVESKTGNLMDEGGKELLKNLEISIADNRLQGIDAEHQKISSQKYQGAVKVNMPKYIPATSSAALSTDAISNQKGQWTINFQVNK